MKTQVSMLALLIGISPMAQATQSPFFTIVDNEALGYATGISDDGEQIIGVSNKNNPADYFSTVPFANFLVDRFRFDEKCLLSNNACDSFWGENEPGFAHQWRTDFLDDLDQRSNVGAQSSSESDGLITALGDTAATRVGYRIEEKTDGKVMGKKLRTAFAIINDSAPVPLFDEASDENQEPHSLSVPTGIKQIDDDEFLVFGTSASGRNKAHSVDDQFYEFCFAGLDDNHEDENEFRELSEYRYCPGVDTQASFWWLTHEGKLKELLLPDQYASGTNSSEALQTASALAVAKLFDSETWYGVGYSSTTAGVSDNQPGLAGRNVASYWQLDLTNSGKVHNTTVIPLPDGLPGGNLRHSWAVGINENGFIIGNQRWQTEKGGNRPVEMFIFKVETPDTTATVPLQDNPIEGANSEAAAINDHDMVVGWRDARGENNDVVGGSANRLQEAFLLDAVTGNNWYINDLICGLDEDDTKVCKQNGFYYDITNAVDISSDGTIAATATRYNSESDLNERINGTVVGVKLVPIEKDYDGNTPEDFEVTEDGGGSLFWLTLLALPFIWWRRYQR